MLTIPAHLNVQLLQYAKRVKTCLVLQGRTSNWKRKAWAVKHWVLHQTTAIVSMWKNQRTSTCLSMTTPLEHPSNPRRLHSSPRWIESAKTLFLPFGSKKNGNGSRLRSSVRKQKNSDWKQKNSDWKLRTPGTPTTTLNSNVTFERYRWCETS